GSQRHSAWIRRQRRHAVRKGQSFDLPQDSSGPLQGPKIIARCSDLRHGLVRISAPSPKSLGLRCVKNGPSARREEGAYLNRYVTDEQRSRRPIFNATLRAAASWLFFRPAAAGLARPVQHHFYTGRQRPAEQEQ